MRYSNYEYMRPLFDVLHGNNSHWYSLALLMKSWLARARAWHWRFPSLVLQARPLLPLPHSSAPAPPARRRKQLAVCSKNATFSSEQPHSQHACLASPSARSHPLAPSLPPTRATLVCPSPLLPPHLSLALLVSKAGHQPLNARVLGLRSLAFTLGRSSLSKSYSCSREFSAAASRHTSECSYHGKLTLQRQRSSPSPRGGFGRVQQQPARGGRESNACT